MSEVNMFEFALRSKFRFPFKGQINTEDLWDLTVRELDGIFKTLNAELKTVSEESLLNTRSNADKVIGVKIEIIKHIVEEKLAEKERQTKAKERADMREKIKEAMFDQQNAELRNKTLAELQEMYNNLDN